MVWPTLLLCVAIIFGATGCSEEPPDQQDSESCETGAAGDECLPCEEDGDCVAVEAKPQACRAGTWDEDADPATACIPWSDCLAGEFISEEGSATDDQQCAECESGTYTESLNSSQCQPHSACAAGTVQTATGTADEPPTCEACAVGTYCAGGTASEKTCASGTWDHDENPASPCVTWTDCIAGQHEAAEGSSTSDRMCNVCAPGSFSTTTNAPTCTAWSDCVEDEYVRLEGTETTDRQCHACPKDQTSTGPNAISCLFPPMTELSAGYGHTCGIRSSDSQLVCWGWDAYDQVSGAPSDEVFDAVSAGVSHTCGIQGRNSHLVCWGDDYYGQASGAPSAEPFHAVSAGNTHTCGIRSSDSHLVCWGMTAKVRSAGPPARSHSMPSPLVVGTAVGSGPATPTSSAGGMTVKVRSAKRPAARPSMRSPRGGITPARFGAVTESRPAGGRSCTTLGNRALAEHHERYPGVAA